MVLCPHCSKETDRDNMPMIPSALMLIFEMTKFSRVFHCADCGQFFIERHPKYREPFCQEMPGGRLELPKECLSEGSKHYNRGK